ncbi:tetratricopeptide repeat protein [Pseudobacteriovorax antillogorgiicola]|uniref:Tetratricopeptide repeat-containing protein n=1 Tax=Pseudobacteriovorax antillogorgiicola TaxID=1513793 RepID=A0A1Y6CLR1_9BACT|nr:hypothetical protein [Pseudobacteriovorax antillogorgiicola]TCS45648.1 hypothetical protein EDD56_12741 [Pseudobacteriovorax antillogorgiicola]SMF72854.1 hypothetical protein SAMN06296036_12740 [Pseudobacteriovorax antillogorgiicola]
MKLVFIILIMSVAPITSASEAIPNPESVRAYKHFWNSFDQYEASRVYDSKETISQAWDQLKQEYHVTKRSMSEQQLTALKRAAEKYRNHIEEHSRADNIPYVLLNLAQILNKIANHYQEFDVTAGTQYRSEALEVLSDISKRFPRFEKREEVLYLKAVTLASIDQKESAYTVWKQLAKIARKTLFGAHAHVAIGDHLFNQEKAIQALKSYDKALRIMKILSASNIDYELLRIQYRIAWAAYRSAELGRCISTAIEILQPGRPMGKLSIKDNIEQDAMELIGDALYEKNDMMYTQATLGRKVLRNYSSGIALRILKRYLSGQIHTDIIDLGEFIIDRFPRAMHLPDILTILAESYGAIENEERRLEALEKLSLLLPRNSLWRSQYRHRFEVIKNMEIKALAASQLLAAHYYRLGMINASVSSFQTAASYYHILVEFNQNHSKAHEWLLRQANAYYFSSHLGEAKKIYESLIKDRKVDQKNLQLASYQLVLSYEKIWRQEFGRSLEKNQKPYQDPIVLQHLRDFETAAEAFSNRFPTSRFNIEGLLRVASANRDMQRLKKASEYWRRVLISQPSADQRALAIRGIVYQKVQSGDHDDIIETVTRYLKLEKWSQIGRNLGRELQGILSQAVRDASDDLNSKGQVFEAGQLLIKIAEDFPGLPQRDVLFRDGVYMLAIAGDWATALKLCDMALNQKSFRYKGDIAYLKGRSLEYQMRFKLAATAYLKMGRRFPKHSRAGIALERASTLAQAEGDIKVAADASVQLAKLQRGKAKKHKYYTQAAQYYTDIADHQNALRYGNVALSTASSREQKLGIRLLVAKQKYALGSESLALKEYKVISKDVQRQKDKIDFEAYSRVLGEASFLLGEEQREIFVDFKIRERQGHWTHNVKEKVERFERLYAAYSTSIKSGHPTWASQSRYYLGQSAENFSREINEALMADDKLKSGTRKRIKNHAIRFQQLAKQFYSENIMERNRKPKDYRHNPWVKKSMIKLAGFHDNKLLRINDEKLPYSMGTLMPQQWSM